MTAKPSARRPPGFWALWFVILATTALAGFLISTSFKIVREADRQDLRHADAIVVFGAAEYAGRPSPVYRARLDHAYELFLRGLAPVVITTGGAGADPKFSEGGVGHDYLMHRGLPESALIAETRGSDTAESSARVAAIMRANHMRTCLAVSDEYHVFRIRRMLGSEGIQVFVAPRPDSRPRSKWQRLLAVLREALSYFLWKMHIPA
jgi:uncharacterized SAM-binding protein YcdF (DUF218 family)